MNNEFISKYLTDVTYATDEQKSKELWDVSGILKNKSNRVFKFDTRHISTFKQGVGKKKSSEYKSR